MPLPHYLYRLSLICPEAVSPLLPPWCPLSVMHRWELLETGAHHRASHDPLVAAVELQRANARLEPWIFRLPLDGDQHDFDSDHDDHDLGSAMGPFGEVRVGVSWCTWVVGVEVGGGMLRCGHEMIAMSHPG